MPSQGPSFPTTAADDGSTGTVAWGTPSNITASDNVRASAFFGGPSATHYLVAAGFNFAIPDGSTINGIVVEWERLQVAIGGED